MDDRHLRKCLTCHQPLYTVVGQRKRHPHCARKAVEARRTRVTDISAAEIEQRFQAAKQAIRRRAA